MDRDLPMPARAHDGDAGVDLFSAIDLKLAPGQRELVPTGIAVAIPHGMVGLVHPRSGLAIRVGLSIVNAPGTVDAGYRGELKVALLNTDAAEPYDIAVGDRIAQLVVMPVPRARFIPVAELPESVRGVGGFGSTGYVSANGDRTEDRA